jgi:sterol desaturase/sphingolipid hydroxylase (fatty acid hydroxylase superfamily)
MWATHAVHHSATKLNFTAAIRLGWTGNISGNFLFFLPLIFSGFHPFAVIGMLGVNLFYQFFIHTAFVSRLGPLEWILNTPPITACITRRSSCLDKNYGGILIVFDRIFGTFAEAPRGQALRYGLVRGISSYNGQGCAWRMAQHDQRFRPRTDAARAVKTLLGPPAIGASLL